MQCVEFETRLNHLLDERLAPGIDICLVEHAQSCPGCTEFLLAHETLLEGVAAMPMVRLRDAQRQALAHRVVAGAFSSGSAAAVGSATVGSATVGSATVGSATVGSATVAPWAVIGLVLATAAAVLIAVLPWFRGERPPAGPPGQSHQIVEKNEQPPVLQEYENLALIARVGYQVADGLTPVTNSMVSALRELRKRPLFRGPDGGGRSSSYLPRDVNALLA